jgi:hypothetical protein
MDARHIRFQDEHKDTLIETLLAKGMKFKTNRAYPLKTAGRCRLVSEWKKGNR